MHRSSLCLQYTLHYIFAGAARCLRAPQSWVPHSESFGHLVDVEHMVSRRLLTNVRGDIFCAEVTSLIVPKPF